MTKKYRKAEPGEPMPLRGRRGEFYHKVMCCDCGLVHLFRHTVVSKSRMVTRAWRLERSTAAARRAKQVKK